MLSRDRLLFLAWGLLLLAAWLWCWNVAGCWSQIFSCTWEDELILAQAAIVKRLSFLI
jgi:hypothetical protein